MATKTWTLGTDYASLPATVTDTTWSATNWQEHTAPPGATTVLVLNNSTSVTAYGSVGHTLTDGAAVDATKAVPLTPGSSVTLDLVGVGGQAFGATPRKFYTVGANLTLSFGVR